MKARKGIKEGFRDTKDTYYDNGSKALSYQESLESTKQSLEDWCEKQIRRYGDKKVWGNTAEEEIKPVLISYIKNAQHKDIRDKNDAENHAFRVAIGRYAMQLAKRYGIDVYDEWSRVNEEAKRGKILNESKIRKIVTKTISTLLKEDFNQFSDGDFGGEDPYASLLDYEKENYEDGNRNDHLENKIYGKNLKNHEVPNGFEKIEREDDEPIYRDHDLNDYVMDDYGKLVPLYEKAVKRRKHTKINENQLIQIVTESLKRIINEVGETKKGQKKLGKLASYRQKQAEDSYFKGDEEKFQDYMKRSRNANKYAGDKLEDGDESDRQSKIKAYQKGEKKGERKKLKEDVGGNDIQELCNVIKNIYKSVSLKYRMSEYKEAFKTAIQNGYTKDDLINAFCKCGLDCRTNPRSIEKLNNMWNSLSIGQTKNH